MSDFNSSLPVRTQSNGDVVAFLADGTINTQLLAIDSSGRVTVKLDDGAGNSITSQANGGQQALDVGINVSGVQIDPRQIRALTSSDVVTANQGASNTNANGWFVRLTDGTNNALVSAAGSLDVTLTTAIPAGANNIGSVNQGTSPWIVKDQADGPVTPGTVASFSQLAGGQYNSSAPTLTTGQQAALQLDSTGKLLVSTTDTADKNYGVVGANTLRTAAQIGNATGAADFNFGAASAQTLRVASLPGNASGLADFGAGATSAQTQRVAANLYDSTGTAISSTNPLNVTLAPTSGGTLVNKYNTTASVAAAASTNHDYSVTSAKVLSARKFWIAGSGKLKAVVQTSPDGTTFTTFWVGFNSTAMPNIDIELDTLAIQDTGAGAKVRITITNLDLLPQDVYSTISGEEH